MSIRGAFSQNNLSTEGLGGDDLYTELWRACAGPLVDVPRIQERVLYFPQGRMEQLEASTNQELNQRIPLFNLPSKILCRVVNFQLRAEQYTNEVYAQITLLPEPDQTEPKIPDSCPPELPRPTIYSFCKVLMASDTSTHGGFWVLRKHANECLPSLVNESADTNPRINIQGSSQFGMAVQAYFSRPTQEAFAYDRMEHISYFQKISYWGYFCLSEIFGGEWEFTCRCQAYLLANRATC